MARAERARPVVPDLVNGMVTAEDLDQPAPPVGVAVTIRLAAWRALRAPDTEVCRDCWTRGRDAALRAFLSGRPEDAAPRGSEHHVHRAFERGRAAAQSVLDDEGPAA